MILVQSLRAVLIVRLFLAPLCCRGGLFSSCLADPVGSTAVAQSSYFYLKCAVINCRSVFLKLPLLRILIETHSLDIVYLTETWLTSEISNNSLFLNDFFIVRKDRVSKRGGGVMILIRKH